MKFLTTFALALLAAAGAHAQSTPLETYMYGRPQATAPYPSTLFVPAVPNGLENSLQNIPATKFNFQPVATKASTGFSAMTTNPGSYTLSDTPLGVVVAGPDQGADGINAACKTAPAIGVYFSSCPASAQRSIKPPRLMSPRPIKSSGKKS